MKRLLLLAACLFMAVPSQAQRWGQYRYAHTTVNIRAERTTASEVVDKLSAGDRVIAHDCRDGWCAVYWFYQDTGEPDEMTPRGFVAQRLLKTNAPVVKQTPRRTCCKICRKGKACGNSCISRRYTCRKPPGCACNG